VVHLLIEAEHYNPTT